MSTNHQCVLPDGRQITLADEVAGRLSCGVIVLEAVSGAPQPEVWRLTAELGQRLHAQYADHLPSQIAGLAEARLLYKSFGVDPSRTRPSSEALLRRVLKGHSLYQVNGMVDVCNLASLKFLLPIGMYNLPAVQGDVSLKIGGTDDHYPGIRKGEVNLGGRLGLFDKQGPFGSPTSDSARTCLSEGTATILAVVMATADYDANQMSENLMTFSGLMTEHCGGRDVFRKTLGGAA